MKKYMCKSLALGMTLLNLCNPVLALSEDIQQENVINSESNLKSYAIKGAKIVGGIFVAMLAGAGVYSSLNIGKRWILKNENMKRLGVDKEIYDSMYKVYHTRDLLRRDFTVQDRENFAEYIYGMYRILDEEPRFIPDNFANVKMSKEEVKIYTCIQLVYVGFFRDDVKISGDKNSLRDIDRVYIDNAFGAFKESDFYKKRNIKEDSEEGRLIKYHELLRNLLLSGELTILHSDREKDKPNSADDIAKIESIGIKGIEGNYLEKFGEKLNEILSELSGFRYSEETLEEQKKQSQEKQEESESSSDSDSDSPEGVSTDDEEDPISSPPPRQPVTSPPPSLDDALNSSAENICKSIDALCEGFKNNVIKVKIPKFIRCDKSLLHEFGVLEMYNDRILRIGTFELPLEKESRLLGEYCDKINFFLKKSKIKNSKIGESLSKLNTAINQAKMVSDRIIEENVL